MHFLAELAAREVCAGVRSCSFLVLAREKQQAQLELTRLVGEAQELLLARRRWTCARGKTSSADLFCVSARASIGSCIIVQQ